MGKNDSFKQTYEAGSEIERLEMIMTTTDSVYLKFVKQESEKNEEYDKLCKVNQKKNT